MAELHRVRIAAVFAADAELDAGTGLVALFAGDLHELADAGRKLIAFGESADSVPETLRRIGDVSAGVQAPVNEIAELYGKARVQGRLFAEDINQLTGRGIPIIQQLARQFGAAGAIPVVADLLIDNAALVKAEIEARGGRAMRPMTLAT